MSSVLKCAVLAMIKRLKSKEPSPYLQGKRKEQQLMTPANDKLKRECESPNALSMQSKICSTNAHRGVAHKPYIMIFNAIRRKLIEQQVLLLSCLSVPEIKPRILESMLPEFFPYSREFVQVLIRR